MAVPWSPWQSGAVAAACAMAAGLLGFRVVEGWEAVASAALAGLMGAIAAEDVRHLRVPDVLNALVAASGLALVWLTAAEPLWALAEVLLQMALCGGALLLLREVFFRLRGVDGLGLGDVKLGAAAGAWIGAEGFALAILAASIAALAYIAIQHGRRGPWPADRRVPFAFYLAPAIWVCWLMPRLFPAS